uniref:Uncharacterized protein n=1 Tax=Palpitomonas bilix TaxID=652834 RepID=A0A7S3DK10_9EUKA|mmetsp:Transcript_41421/g.107310  ORF Transcript_41421/g.107310 Transcript_41421/m.107310 type:complete len:153 (+) Transcript_41421:43-501(+)
MVETAATDSTGEAVRDSTPGKDEDGGEAAKPSSHSSAAGQKKRRRPEEIETDEQRMQKEDQQRKRKEDLSKAAKEEFEAALHRVLSEEGSKKKREEKAKQKRSAQRDVSGQVALGLEENTCILRTAHVGCTRSLFLRLSPYRLAPVAAVHEW